MVAFIVIEVPMAEGTKLVVLFDPVKPGELPRTAMPAPGEIITPEGDAEINAGRRRVRLEVVNTGDRAIQVRSHAHFFETNRALRFDRSAAFGMRLDRPSRTGMRFEPGMPTIAELVEIGGTGEVHGFADLTNGSIHDPAIKTAALAEAKRLGYLGV